MRRILIMLFISIIAQMHAQVNGEADYLIRYEVDFILDSTNRADVKNEVHRLYTGSTVSNYISEGTILNDSIQQALRNQPHSNRQNIRRTRSGSFFKPIVYKNLNEIEVWVQNTVATDWYIYQELEVPIQWKFTNESKEIGPYTVHKATTSFGGRSFEAWFTPEIPILDGPYVFGGLPGLIIELYDTNRDYHFNLASIQPLNESYFINSESRNSKQVSKEEFIKIHKNYRNNPSASFSGIFPSNFEIKDDTGKTITLKDLERKAKENVDKRNNLIEHW